jgi:hypothetical protein
MPLDDPDNPLAIEIRQETAAAYFAACKKMVTSLESLKAFDHAFPSSSRDDKQITRRSKLLEDAIERVYFVVIQREAMKLSGYEQFFDNYEVPNEVRTRLGTRRRN